MKFTPSNLTFAGKEYRFSRYPETDNLSLQPWNAADLHMLKMSGPLGYKFKNMVIQNDAHGVLSVCMQASVVKVVQNTYTQCKAVRINWNKNYCPTKTNLFALPMDLLPPWELAFQRIPKSLELFELFLVQLAQSANRDSQLLAGFMTRHYSPRLIKIAQKYADEVKQSLAWKKSRVLSISKWKPCENSTYDLFNRYVWKGVEIKQYYGVFSAKRIDEGTQFLLENFRLEGGEQDVLDYGCGSGVIAKYLMHHYLHLRLQLLDDSAVAISSAKSNLPDLDPLRFHWRNSLKELDSASLDLIISNPPFHLEHENNMEIAIRMFKEARRCLRPEGRLVIVANRHLNYSTHLKKWYHSVRQLEFNKKFEILEAKQCKSMVFTEPVIP